MCFKIKRPFGHRKNTTILGIGITSLRIELGYANGVGIFHTGGLKDADQKLWLMVFITPGIWRAGKASGLCLDGFRLDIKFSPHLQGEGSGVGECQRVPPSPKPSPSRERK
jgi:hypothetical protein